MSKAKQAKVAGFIHARTLGIPDDIARADGTTLKALASGNDADVAKYAKAEIGRRASNRTAAGKPQVAEQWAMIHAAGEKRAKAKATAAKPQDDAITALTKQVADLAALVAKLAAK